MADKSGGDQTTESSNMSANRSTFHPFGRLPFELQHQIWEIAVLDVPSRVCSWEDDTQYKFRSGMLDWNDPSGLVVLDSPSLRYVCQESRRVALKHSATVGWTVPGTTHPYRRYDTRRDILYTDNLRTLPSLDAALESQNHCEVDEPNASAAMRIRQTRHIAIPWWLLKLMTYHSWQSIDTDEGFRDSFPQIFMHLFPQLEEITVAISQMDVADHIASRELCSTWQVPQRRCKLDTFATFEPTTEERQEITIVDNAYREEPLRSLYRSVGRASGNFERAANIIASTTGTPRVPALKIAQVYQLSQGTDAGYRWEELPDPR